MQTHETNAKNWLHIHPEKSVRVKYISRNDRISPVAIAVAWERAELVQWLNTLIGVASMDGTLDQLKRHYVESFDWKNGSWLINLIRPQKNCFQAAKSAIEQGPVQTKTLLSEHGFFWYKGGHYGFHTDRRT
jgi:hypothetical protein